MDLNPDKKSASRRPVDRLIYILSCVLTGGVFLMFLLQAAGVFTLTDDLRFPCAFRRATGLYCPGCGGSHALTSLLRGDIFDSILSHPFVPYLIGCALIDVILGTVALIRRRQLPRFRPIYAYIGIAILMIQWIIKNILLLNQ